MLKIYRAIGDIDGIKIEDHIDFIKGQYDTGLNGFGQVGSGNYNVFRANYELQSLDSFKDYLQTVKEIDGYVENFAFWNPVTYKKLEIFKNVPKTFDSYEEHRLNEEGIILFTNYVRLIHPNNDSVQKVFGRHPENGMYLIMPNASFSMTKHTSFNGNITENYEVLQSQSLGKQLFLTKMNRKI